MAIEHIRLSQQAKDQLIKLKRSTGIQNWNVLCRWAFCLSLAEPSSPAPMKIPSDSNIEMTWKVFAGNHQELYFALLKERCNSYGLGVEQDVLSEQFRLHLHRGIGHLSSLVTGKQVTDISGLLALLGKLRKIDVVTA